MIWYIDSSSKKEVVANNVSNQMGLPHPNTFENWRVLESATFSIVTKSAKHHICSTRSEAGTLFPVGESFDGVDFCTSSCGHYVGLGVDMVYSRVVCNLAYRGHVTFWEAPHFIPFPLSWITLARQFLLVTGGTIVGDCSWLLLHCHHQERDSNMVGVGFLTHRKPLSQENRVMLKFSSLIDHLPTPNHMEMTYPL